MKKLILINLLLALLIYYLPKQTTMQNKDISVVTEQIIQIDKKEISSRSSDTARDSKEKQAIVNISDNGIDYIKSKESFSSTAYYNSGEDAFTIGYGHKDKNISATDTITEEEADKLLRTDLQKYFNYVVSYCSYLDLSQNEIDMLVSFTYNGGEGMLQQLTGYKTRNKQEIAEHWTAYTSKNDLYKQGLLQRRQEELNIFLKGYSNEE